MSSHALYEALNINVLEQRVYMAPPSEFEKPQHDAEPRNSAGEINLAAESIRLGPSLELDDGSTLLDSTVILQAEQQGVVSREEASLIADFSGSLSTSVSAYNSRIISDPGKTELFCLALDKIRGNHQQPLSSPTGKTSPPELKQFSLLDPKLQPYSTQLTRYIDSHVPDEIPFKTELLSELQSSEDIKTLLKTLDKYDDIALNAFIDAQDTSAFHRTGFRRASDAIEYVTEQTYNYLQELEHQAEALPLGILRLDLEQIPDDFPGKQELLKEALDGTHSLHEIRQVLERYEESAYQEALQKRDLLASGELEKDFTLASLNLGRRKLEALIQQIDEIYDI